MSSKEYPDFFDRNGKLIKSNFPGIGNRGEINRIDKQSRIPKFKFDYKSTPVTKTPFFSDDIEEDLSPQNKPTMNSFQRNTTQSMNDLNSNSNYLLQGPRNPGTGQLFYGNMNSANNSANNGGKKRKSKKSKKRKSKKSKRRRKSRRI
jgi:hypothetical protein